jgi:hypothetical protein
MKNFLIKKINSKRGEIGLVVVLSFIAVLSLGFVATRVIDHIKTKGSSKYQNDLNDLNSVINLMKNDYCLKGNLIDVSGKVAAFPPGRNSLSLREIKVGSTPATSSTLFKVGSTFQSLKIERMSIEKHAATASIDNDAYLKIEVSSASADGTSKVGEASTYLVMQLEDAPTKRVINCLGAAQAALIEKPELVCPTLGDGWNWNLSNGRCEFGDPELGMCPAGYFVKGIKPNGKIDCQTAPEPPFRFLTHWGCPKPGEKTIEPSCRTTTTNDDCRPANRPLDPRECFNVSCKKRSKADSGSHECMNFPIVGPVFRTNMLCKLGGRKSNFSTCVMVERVIPEAEAVAMGILTFTEVKKTCVTRNVPRQGPREFCNYTGGNPILKPQVDTECGRANASLVTECRRVGRGQTCGHYTKQVRISPLAAGTMCINQKIL